MHKVLIINPFGIGDVLFTTPVITALRRKFPSIEISYLVNRRCESFMRQYPQVQQVFVYERDEFKALSKKNPLLELKAWQDLISDIKNQGFDVVFDFSLNTLYGFLGFAAGIPTRIGFDYKGRGKFLTQKIPFAGFDDKHVIEYYLDMLRLLNIEASGVKPFMPIDQSDQLWANEWLIKNGISSNKPLLAVIPGGGGSWGSAAKNKRWPIEKYAHLVDKIIENYDAQIILMGDIKELGLSQELSRLVHFPIYNAVGQTTISQMAALLNHCRLAIVNDGGPLHIAVACGVKTVSIFGPVDQHVYGPYPAHEHISITANLPCQPCYRRFRMSNCTHLACLNNLEIEDVYRKVAQLL